MRISTAQFYESSAANYQKNFANIVKSSEEASSLVRVNTAADDPVGASRLLQLGQQASLLDQYDANTNTIKATLGQAEAAMTSITNVLQRAKELAVSSGNAGFTDADRQSNAAELGQIEEQLLSLMNTQDENGKYIFAGSKSDTPPFSRNSDGTYSYNGDQTSLSLPVGDGMSMATNSTGWDVFQQAINTSRTQVSAVLLPAQTDDGRLVLSNGQVSNSATYNSSFRSGAPYSVTVVNGNQLKITDAALNDVTGDASANGIFKAGGGADSQTVSFRGVDIRLNVNLQTGDDPATALNGKVFTLEAKPDSFNVARSPGNPSTAQVLKTEVTDAAAYNAAFPNGGAILKIGAGDTFELYASPLTASSKPVANGTLTGTPPDTAVAAGVTFTLSGTPDDKDQFSVAVNNHQTQNILDTVSQLRTALSVPISTDPVAKQKLVAALDSGMANLTTGTDQVSNGISSVGGRGSALDTQVETNASLRAGNKETQSSIRDSDAADVMTRLTLQQTMLQASQLAFSKIAQLGLFNKV